VSATFFCLLLLLQLTLLLLLSVWVYLFVAEIQNTQAPVTALSIQLQQYYGKCVLLMITVMLYVAMSVVKDASLSLSVLQRPDFVFLDDYLAEGLLRLCVHLVKVSLHLV